MCLKESDTTKQLTLHSLLETYSLPNTFVKNDREDVCSKIHTDKELLLHVNDKEQNGEAHNQEIWASTSGS